MNTRLARLAVVLAVLVVPAVGGAGCGPRTVAAARICTPDARRCVDAGRVERCFGDGTLWIPYQTCGAGLTCTDGACTAPDADPELDADVTDVDMSDADTGDPEPFDRDLGERELPDLDAEYTNPCPGRDDMVWTGLWYCIDKYEAVLSPHADCRGDFIDGVDVPIPDGFPRCTGCEELGTCARCPAAQIKPDGTCAEEFACTPNDSANVSTPLYACSLPGVLPTRNITWYQAQTACSASGTRLCTVFEWQLACAGREGRAFVYGNDYRYDVCNDGVGQPNPFPTANVAKGVRNVVGTGRYAECKTPAGIFDLNGNVSELVGPDALAESVRDGPGEVGDSYDSIVLLGGDGTVEVHTNRGCDVRAGYRTVRSDAKPWVVDSTRLDDIGFRCCVSGNNITDIRGERR